MAKALSEAKAAQLAAQADRERIQRKVPRGLKPRGFPDDPSPRFRGGIQARVSSSGVLTCRLCRVSRRGCVVSILRSPRLVSWGSSPGVPDPWYWLTFYAGSLPVPATAYVRRLDRTGNGPVIKDRLFLSTFVGAASSTALERAWHPPRFIGEMVRQMRRASDQGPRAPLVRNGVKWEGVSSSQNRSQSSPACRRFSESTSNSSTRLGL